MSGKPAEPRPSGQPDIQAGAGARTGDSQPARERIGPLAIARYVKGDGRALILYTRVERPRA